MVLMGGALNAALNGRQHLAISHFKVNETRTLRSRDNSGKVFSRSDRVANYIQLAQPATNILMVSTVSKENNRDVIKVRPFMYVEAPLAIANKKATGYPKFNPLHIFTEAKDSKQISSSSDEIYGAQVESEVAVETKEYVPGEYSLANTRMPSAMEISSLIRNQAIMLDGTSTLIDSTPTLDPARFEIDSDPVATAEALISPDVRITAQNVSTIPFHSTDDTNINQGNERLIPVRTQTTVSKVLENEHIQSSLAAHLDNLLSADLGPQELRVGDHVRLFLTPSKASDEQTPKDQNFMVQRLSIYRGANHLASIARNDKGKFVYAKEPAKLPASAYDFKETPVLPNSKLPTVYDGIYRAALSYGLSKDLTRLLVRTYAFDVDFRRKISPRDKFTALLSLEDGQKKPNENSEILYTSIKLNNVERKYYRFRDAASGQVDYYDENGKSAKKFLLRKPVPNGKFRSPFGMRVHPISRIRKMHWGIDWSAPRGTPIIAAGNGVVEKAGWAGGYGKQTIIRHANGYKTSYSHQTRFAKGIHPGARVRLGQIIGYIGTTGYSTGPHLHYEMMVNGSKVNPMRIRLPKGKVLKGKALQRFEIERDRINALLEQRKEDRLERVALK